MTGFAGPGLQGFVPSAIPTLINLAKNSLFFDNWFSSMPGDWELPAEETARRVLADLAPGDIVVLHDGRPAREPPELSWPTREATVDAVGLVLEQTTRRGLRAVTISELVASR